VIEHSCVRICLRALPGGGGARRRARLRNARASAGGRQGAGDVSTYWRTPRAIFSAGGLALLGENNSRERRIGWLRSFTVVLEGGTRDHGAANRK
jgi:hypothetical protein